MPISATTGVPRPGGALIALSAFDLQAAGIGPSFSYTVGPMRAAPRFTVSGTRFRSAWGT
ncbi:serine dehydratase beta chain [Streptomyces sp. V4I2]|uniref:serine dehydratase beta chain n=1 Tax=Streptomyces sp. V4I2 TaxID=3042280 RepID=UPI0035945F00